MNKLNSFLVYTYRLRIVKSNLILYNLGVQKVKHVPCVVKQNIQANAKCSMLSLNLWIKDVWNRCKLKIQIKWNSKLARKTSKLLPTSKTWVWCLLIICTLRKQCQGQRCIISKHHLLQFNFSGLFIVIAWPEEPTEQWELTRFSLRRRFFKICSAQCVEIMLEMRSYNFLLEREEKF